MDILLAVLLVLGLLVASEIWWRKHNTHGELSRKFVHITVGSFVAFWPFFLTWQQIELLSVAFLIAVALSKYLRLFQAIHSVQRPTWGEMFFAIAVGATALITHNKWIYAAALLQMSMADGLAAIIGSRYGKASRYLVFSHAKSLVGTATFFAVSVLILAGFSHWGDAPISLAWIIMGAASASLIEILGIYGFDNLLVPVLIALILSHA